MMLADGNLGQMMEPVELAESYPNEHDKSGWALTGREGTRRRISSRRSISTPTRWRSTSASSGRSTARSSRPRSASDEYQADDAEVILVAYGIVSRVARAVVETLREQGIKAGLVRPITLWPFPIGADPAAGRAGEVLPGRRDVDGADGRGRDARGQRPPPGLLLRPLRRQRADPGRGRGRGRSGTCEGDMQKVFERPKSLNDRPFHYCPGLRPRHRPPDDGRGDRRARPAGADDPDLAGRLLGLRVLVLRGGQRAGGARARAGGRHGPEAREPRLDRDLLPGRRRPGLVGHGRDHPRRRRAARTSPSSSSTTPSTA